MHSSPHTVPLIFRFSVIQCVGCTVLILCGLCVCVAQAPDDDIFSPGQKMAAARVRNFRAECEEKERQHLSKLRAQRQQKAQDRKMSFDTPTVASPRTGNVPTRARLRGAHVERTHGRECARAHIHTHTHTPDLRVCRVPVPFGRVMLYAGAPVRDTSYDYTRDAPFQAWHRAIRRNVSATEQGESCASHCST